MSPSTPFFDRTSGSLDTAQILREAIPLAKLVALVAVAALVPFAIGATIEVFAVLFTALAQFVLAVGSCLVLLYVVTRAIQLAEE